MDTAVAAETLRDTVSNAFDTVEAAAQPSQIGSDAPPESKIESAEVTAQRARDEAGRFAKEAADKVAAPQAQKPDATLSSGDPAQTAPAVAAPVIPRPASWKKDYDAHWTGLAPELKAYIRQREQEYQSGVSTYKSEAENAKALQEAIAPFLPNLQRHNLEPTQWIRNLGAAHERLALGSQAEKTQTFASLMQQYGVDPNHLVQVLSGQQPQYTPQQMQPQYQPAQQAPDIEKLIEAKLAQKEVNQEYQRFVSEAPEKYPHFEEVKDTMAGLLQAELAQDYKSAYDAALRHPRHAEIWDAMQSQQREQTEAAEKAKVQAAVTSARSRTVSVRSTTPSGSATTVNGAKSLRDMISESYDSTMSNRV